MSSERKRIPSRSTLVIHMNMKRLFYVMAAIAALGLAVPTMASAETIVVKRHDGWHHRHHDHGWHRHEGWRHHEGRHHHGDRTVIVKRSHHDY
jgi:Ni/Co efflux regulator RcnB